MSTEDERAKGSPLVFTRTSTDPLTIVDTAEYFDILDVMDITLSKKSLLAISYSLEVEIPSPAENGNLFKTVFILCTLDPTPPRLDIGEVTCHPGFPSGPTVVAGSQRGIPFGNNFGLTTQRYHGAHSFTWVQRATVGPHKIVMGGKYDISLLGPPPSPPPNVIVNPRILKRALVVQAFPN